MTTQSGNFSCIYTSSITMDESDNSSIYASDQTSSNGLFLVPSEGVAGRPADITGYILKAATAEGKLSWGAENSSGIFDASLSTASSPSYGFVTSSSGMFSSGTDLGFSTGGISRIFINSSGLVGIGQSTPTFNLEVKGNFNTSITGSFSAINANATLTGVGSSFTTAVKIGDAIQLTDSLAVISVYTVSSITSNTVLTLSGVFTGTTGTVTVKIDSSLFSVYNGSATPYAIIDKNGCFVLGASSPSAFTKRLYLESTLAGDETGTINNTQIASILAEPTNSSLVFSGILSNLTLNATASNYTGNIRPFSSTVTNNSTGTCTSLSCVRTAFTHSSVGTVTNAFGFITAFTNSTTGTITNSFNYFITTPSYTAGSINTNVYGLYINDLYNVTLAPAAWGVYQLGTNTNNYFQGTVAVGTTTPNANAILDVSSTTKAFMPPRMTTVQKNAVAVPTAGMVVYDSTLNKLCVYTGAAWQTITSV